VCIDCAKPLLVRYQTDELRGAELARAWAARPSTLWRFREILPIGPGEEPVSLGEGGTPLIELPASRAGLDGLRVLVKDEGQNPTGSFKDRGLSAAVTRGVLDGVSSFVIPSAGNAGAALAAYSARAGARCRVYIPEDTPAGVVRRCELYGAEIERVRGLITDCGRLASEFAERTGAYNVSTLREPYRIEGKKTMMLEIVAELDWRPPEAIVYPTGGGTGLIGSWKALAELEQLGLTNASTRLYSVQAEGCAPIVRAWEDGVDIATPWQSASTAAWGLRVPAALGDFLILEALRASGGGAVAVSETAMAEATTRLGRLGVSAAIEGGATLAAARRLREAGELRDGETVVLFNTGNSLTY
jgi:threonine synthase